MILRLCIVEQLIGHATYRHLHLDLDLKLTLSNPDTALSHPDHRRQAGLSLFAGR